MIKAILIFNNHGKPRLSKFYQRYVRDGRRDHPGGGGWGGKRGLEPLGGGLGCPPTAPAFLGYLSIYLFIYLLIYVYRVN